MVRKTVSRMLAEAGHTVVPFEDSAAALAHVGADPSVTCVLTSLEVAPLDGLELCWALRALADDRRPLTILVMSSARENRPLDEVLDSGADDFLTKPPATQELHARLRSAERVLRLQQELIRQADTDHLTQLLNRRALMRQGHRAVEQASAVDPLAVLLIDIDHFKSINDSHGHDVGDVVIRHVAHILREAGGIAGRLGGEEFALLLQGHCLGGAAVVAHRIRRRCALPIPLGQNNAPLRFTVSVGLSEWSDGASVDTLLKEADLALYAAKQGGRNRVAVISASLQPELID
ncbi:diguanylate cyclase [Methylobacterium sp. 1030]|uniref:GGDEF domain-containing response regulator n=1 Tax=Methylobacterium sp. 1030 TaxID=3156404 RepID=UPI00339B9C9F